MATVILVVGIMGMIQAVTIGAEMLATARRQTLAAQIITHEIEKLRLKSWAQIQSLGDASATAYTSYDTDGQFTDAINASGVSTADWKIAVSVADLTTNLREVTFTVTWQKGGTTSAAVTPTGSWLDRLAFYRESPIARTYTRKGAAWFGKYGLNLSYQR